MLELCKCSLSVPDRALAGSGLLQVVQTLPLYTLSTDASEKVISSLSGHVGENF